MAKKKSTEAPSDHRLLIALVRLVHGTATNEDKALIKSAAS